MDCFQHYSNCLIQSCFEFRIDWFCAVPLFWRRNCKMKRTVVTKFSWQVLLYLWRIYDEVTSETIFRKSEKQWMKRKRKSLSFAIPIIWSAFTNHFYITNNEGYSQKEEREIEYPNVPSAITPVPHNAELSVLTACLDWQVII